MAEEGMEVAMGSFSEIGLLLLLVLAFSAPLLQNVLSRYRRQEKEEEKN